MRELLASLVPVICPPEATPLADGIVEHMMLTVGAMPPLLQRGFATGVATYDLGALPRYRKRARNLTGRDAERYYESWFHGITPVHHQFAKLVKQLMSMSCYEQPELLERIGYRVAPWIAEVTKKRLTMFADDIKKQDTQIFAPDPLRPAHAKAKKEVA